MSKELRPLTSTLCKQRHQEYADYIERNVLTKQSEVDTSVIARDTDEFYGKLSLFGGQRQETSQGTINLAVLEEGNHVSGNVIITVTNGIVAGSGTNNTDTTIILKIGTVYLKKDKTYYYNKLGDTAGQGAYLTHNGQKFFGKNEERSFVAIADEECSIYVTVGAGQTPTGQAQILISETSGDTWVQGKKQIPSLVYPSKIEAVGDNVNELEQGTIASATGTNNDSNQRVRTKEYIKVVANTECIIDADGADEVVVFEYDKSKAKISNTSWESVPHSFTIGENTRYIRYAFRKKDNSVLTVDSVKDKSKYFSCVEINSSNKNLFEETYNNKAAKNQYNSIIRGDFTLKENETYTVSFDTNSNNGQVYINEVLFNTGQRRACNGKRQSITAIAKISGNFIDRAVIKTGLNVETAYDISNVQIELAETNSDYIEHCGQTLTMPIQSKMYEGDTFERIGGIWYEKHCKKERIITGNDIQSVSSNNRVFFKISSVPGFKKISEEFYYGNIDKNTIESNVATSLTGHSLTWLATAKKGDWISSWNNPNDANGFVLRTDKEFATKEEAIIYFNENPFTVVYELLEIEYIKCTDEQSKIFDKIDTYKNGTIITTDNDLCKISLRYKEDYDKRITALEKQINTATEVAESE